MTAALSKITFFKVKANINGPYTTVEKVVKPIAN